MTETMQMRTTQEESGAYRVFAAATVNGVQPAKGLAVHQSLAEDLSDFIEVELSDDADGLLTPEKFTGSTGRYSTEGPAIRHLYIDPSVLEGFDDFDAEETEKGSTEGLPSNIGITLSASTEEAYEESKADRQEQVEEDTEEVADSILGETADGGDSDESDDSDEEELEVDNDELGITADD